MTECIKRDTKVYVVTYFYNSGWGSRIDNFNKYIDTEVASSLHLAKEWVGKYTKAPVRARSGSWYSDGKQRTANIHIRTVDNLSSEE